MHRIVNNLFLDIDHAGLLFPAGNIASVTQNVGVTMLDGTSFDMQNTPDVYGKISRGYGSAFRAAEDCLIVHNTFAGIRRYAVIAVDKKKSEKGSLPIRGNVIAANVFESAPERRNDPFMHIQYPDENTITQNVYRLDPATKWGELGEKAVMEDWQPQETPLSLGGQMEGVLSDEKVTSVSFPVSEDLLGRERHAEQPVIGALMGPGDDAAWRSVLPPVPPMPGSLRAEPVQAAFEVFPAVIQSGDLLVLDAAYSGGEIVEYHWDFQDGSSSRSRGNAIAHRWEKAGTYAVRLTVRDEAGQISTTEKQIVVGGKEVGDK